MINKSFIFFILLINQYFNAHPYRITTTLPDYQQIRSNDFSSTINEQSIEDYLTTTTIDDLADYIDSTTTTIEDYSTTLDDQFDDIDSTSTNTIAFSTSTQEDNIENDQKTTTIESFLIDN